MTRLTADTNVLVRLFVDDDVQQSELATQVLEDAELIAISVQSLCELAWVLNTHYDVSRADIAAAIRRLIEIDKVLVDREIVAAGLLILEAGGDFADGVIASEGRMLGGETFVTFDKKASKLIAREGHQTRLLPGKG